MELQWMVGGREPWEGSSGWLSSGRDSGNQDFHVMILAAFRFCENLYFSRISRNVNPHPCSTQFLPIWRRYWGAFGEVMRGSLKGITA